MIALACAPTNLGLRPPQPTSVPGCAKAREALREAGLFRASPSWACATLER
jgi:arginase